MKCYVYRSDRKLDTYLYLPVRDDFSQIPDSLLKIFGTPIYALEFDLTSKRKLAQVDAQQVLFTLKNQGYFLQMPPINQRAI